MNEKETRKLRKAALELMFKCFKEAAPYMTSEDFEEMISELTDYFEYIHQGVY